MPKKEENILAFHGKIEDISDDMTAKTGGKYVILTIDGKGYTDWDNLSENLNVGDHVNGTYALKGTYMNLRSLAKAETEESSSDAVAAQRQTTLQKDDSEFYRKTMFETLEDMNAMHASPDFSDEFKKAIDWSDLVCSVFISRVRGQMLTCRICHNFVKKVGEKYWCPKCNRTYDSNGTVIERGGN